jgi:ER lumen protein retaining receptor
MWSNNSASGVSIKTLQLYALVFFTRLASILRHQGYLPFDQTGDWFYHVVETMSFIAVGMALYGMFGPLLSTYAEKHDRFGNLHIPSELGTLYLVIPCVLLAVIFHP